MKNLMKRGLAVVLALMMCVGMLGTTAFAANYGDILGKCSYCGGNLIAQGFSDAKGDAYYCDRCGTSGQMLPSTPETKPEETKPETKPEYSGSEVCPKCGKQAAEKKPGDKYACYYLNCACGYSESVRHQYKTSWDQEFCDNCGATNPNYKAPVEKPHVHNYELQTQFLSSGTHTYVCTNEEGTCDAKSYTKECIYNSVVTDPVTGEVKGEVCKDCGGIWYYSNYCAHKDKTYTCFVEATHGKPGKKTWKCNLCGDEQTEDCPALPEECVYPDGPSEKVGATCTTDGYEVYYCKYHGNGCDRDPLVKEDPNAPAHNHSYMGAGATKVDENQHKFACIYTEKYLDITHPELYEDHKFDDPAWPEEYKEITNELGLVIAHEYTRTLTCLGCGYQKEETKRETFGYGLLSVTYSGAEGLTPDNVSEYVKAGESYSASAPDIEGYTKVVSGGELTGTMTEDGVTITVAYSPIMYTLTVRHVTADGAVLDTEESQVAYGASYSASARTFAGYNAGTTADVTSGTMTGNVTVTFTYARTAVPPTETPSESPAPSETPSVSPAPSVSPSTQPSTNPIVTPENPVEDINEPDVPLGEDPADLVDIPQDDVPLAELPEDMTEIDDGDVPLADVPEELTEIDDDEVPLAAVPQTGDISIIWYGVSALSACGLTAVCASKKREDEEE